MATGPGKKLYRRKAEGPAAADAAAQSTKIVLANLTCITTEDNAGADECELRI